MATSKEEQVIPRVPVVARINREVVAVRDADLEEALMEAASSEYRAFRALDNLVPIAERIDRASQGRQVQKVTSLFVTELRRHRAWFAPPDGDAA